MALSLSPYPSAASGVLSPSPAGAGSSDDGVGVGVDVSVGGGVGVPVGVGDPVGVGVGVGVAVGSGVSGGSDGEAVGDVVVSGGLDDAVPVEHELVQSSARAAPMPVADAVSSTAQRRAVRRRPARRDRAVVADDSSVTFARIIHPTVPGRARLESESGTGARRRQRGRRLFAVDQWEDAGRRFLRSTQGIMDAWLKRCSGDSSASSVSSAGFSASPPRSRWAARRTDRADVSIAPTCR